VLKLFLVSIIIVAPLGLLFGFLLVVEPLQEVLHKHVLFSTLIEVYIFRLVVLPQRFRHYLIDLVKLLVKVVSPLGD